MFLHHAALELGMAGGVDRAGAGADEEIALVGEHRHILQSDELDDATVDLLAAFEVEPGLLAQLAPRGFGEALAGVDRATRGRPESRAVARVEAEQQHPALVGEQQEPRRRALGGRVAHASPGALARIASAWMRLSSRSASAWLTIRCRWTRFRPSNAALSTSTVKCDSPVPLSPIWPAW